MPKSSVFRVAAIDTQADRKTTRREITARRDIVASEEVDRRGSSGHRLADPELTVGIERGRAGSLDMRATDLGPARNVIPQNVARPIQKIAEQRLPAFLLVRRPRCCRRPQSG